MQLHSPLHDTHYMMMKTSFLLFCSIECDEALESDCHREGDGEDLPVQGPLPQDPEDAPFLKNESGIRKL